MSEAVQLSDHVCELGEGPSYDPDTGTLWWFDILGRSLLEMAWPDGRTVVHDLPVMASAIARLDAGRQLLVTENGLYVRTMADGALTLHRGLEDDNAATRSNDARVHPCGAFWIGTMGKRAEPGAGAIYWAFEGEVRPLFRNITIPNAICFSPDGAMAYFTDSAVNKLMRVACDPATGEPLGEPAVLHDQTGEKGVLDGAICDVDGIIWNARWGGGCVDAYTPNGQRIATHDVPARQASCPVFCGPDGGALAVTTAWEGMDEPRRAADPGAGRIYRLPVSVNGRFDPPARP